MARRCETCHGTGWLLIDSKDRCFVCGWPYGSHAAADGSCPKPTDEHTAWGPGRRFVPTTAAKEGT